MTNRFHPLIACFLAVCVALAGVVGISPTLHVLVEHGGQGPAHTHRGGPAVPARAVTPSDSPHAHPHHPEVVTRAGDRVAPAACPAGFVSVHRSFSLPELPVARLWQTLALALERASAAGRPADSGSPGHEHHSLAQLLACGLIEQSIDPPLFEVGALPPPFVPPSPQEVLLLPGFDPQTAGRAPPSAWN